MSEPEHYGQIGEFWLVKRPSNDKFYICWRDSAAGQRRHRSTGTGDLRAAEKALAEHALSHGAAPHNAAPSELTIAEILLRYYNVYAQFIASSVQQKIACALWTGFYDDAVISDLTPAKQREFHEHLLDLGHSKSYADKTISTGRAALRMAWKEQQISSAPFIKSFLSKEEKKAAPPKGRPMTLKEIGSLLNAFDEKKRSGHMVIFILTMLNTMCRPDAALDLSVNEFDDDIGAIDLNQRGRVQTKKYRPVVPMTSVMDRLRTGVTGHIVNINGKPVGDVKTAWMAGRRRAGLDKDVQPYSLRHTMSRLLIARGVPRYENSLMLGHLIPEGVTSMTYAPVVIQETAKARAAIEAIMIELQKYTRHVIIQRIAHQKIFDIREPSARHSVLTSIPIDD